MMVDARTFRDPICATLAWVVMYYIFLYSQSVVTFYLYLTAKADEKDDKKVSFGKIKYQSSGKLQLTIQRTVGNTMEQAFPFLMGLWLHAAFVSPSSAASVGYIYVITRSYYPFAFYLGLPYLLLSTVPGYACIFYLFFQVFTSTNS